MDTIHRPPHRLISPVDMDSVDHLAAFFLQGHNIQTDPLPYFSKDMIHTQSPFALFLRWT